jgi:molecular chaperone GrpE
MNEKHQVNKEDNTKMDIHEEQSSDHKAVQEEELPLTDEELEALCRERICPECPEKKEKDAEVLRIQADADNYRKRMAREKEQFCKFATESLLEDIIPVIDNLELAIEHGRHVDACQDLVQGIDMTIKIFHETLKKHGLEPVELEQGQEFDPAWHEAMAEEEREDLKAGHVCQILQKGYTLKDRLLRPAKVVVSKKCKNSD